MTVGFVMLAHTALDRAAQVARHLAAHGCPVAIHVDRRTPMAEFRGLEQRISEEPLITLLPRIACDWGTWSLVSATRRGAAALLDRHPEIGHVFLMSGACLPIKPVPELLAFLKRHQGTDFIESVTIRDVPWTQGGLSEERFTLSFPFAWKRQKRLFDIWVDLQRKIGRRRRMPEALKPHMGSQWWCLSRETLTKIRSDPNRVAVDRYFRRVWIPDESYYQTMVRRFGHRIESMSLTLSKFDFQGKPHLFYDDHLSLLRTSNEFFARKIWRGASGLYDAFLTPRPAGEVPEPPVTATEIDRVFAAALKRRTEGRQGLLSAARFPDPGYDMTPTAAPYSVFHGFSELFEDFPGWIAEALGSTAHGHLFAPDRAEFAQGAHGGPGGLSTSAALRNYNPESFLKNLIWSTRGEHQSFLYGPGDCSGISELLASDSNAYVAAVSGTWALPLLRSGRAIADIRPEAARLQKREAKHLLRLRERQTRARVRLWTLAEFVADPALPLQVIIDDFSVPGAQHLTQMPRLKPMEGLAGFLQELRNAGMSPHTAGDIPEIDRTHTAERIGRGRERGRR
ncbi:glycosyl transferase [Alphaproteobacteria bacterium GH1-50]|uniref:Peptide O-xylosyltransferase n=1 Tax=Kangsaoukella pontilimi TaxID=2691042 RepID=A0A7C9IGW6_9RHOB|nr:beta-1,6-N-acetylglucosaminyltransferase [Kangsaoukella pontilimi]MXQ08309.1 glycosyl transferase [Kangsaoukella pontilimi]